MSHSRILATVVLSMAMGTVNCADKLVLDLDMDSDLLSLAHHIDGFIFTPTMNFSDHKAGNLSDQFQVDGLKNQLVASALLRIDGEVAGYATEQEMIVSDPNSGSKIAESAWLITLDHNGMKGVLAVAQQENAGPVFGVVSQVMVNPDGDWPDELQRFLSSSNNPNVQLATGDFTDYLGGRFEEYNFINPSDLKKFGRFRAKIQFIIYPGD